MYSKILELHCPALYYTTFRCVAEALSKEDRKLSNYRNLSISLHTCSYSVTLVPDGVSESRIVGIG